MAKLFDGQKLDFPIKIYGDYKGYMLWIIGLGIFILAMLYHAIFLMPRIMDFENYKVHIILIIGSLTAIIGLILAYKNRRPIMMLIQQGIIYKRMSIDQNEKPDLTWDELEKIEIDYGKYCKNGSISLFLKKPMLSGEPKTIHFFNGARLYGALINMREFENIIRQIFIEEITPIFHIQKIKFLDEYTKNPILKKS